MVVSQPYSTLQNKKVCGLHTPFPNVVVSQTSFNALDVLQIFRSKLIEKFLHLASRYPFLSFTVT
jgi:hypothetical protein